MIGDGQDQTRLRDGVRDGETKTARMEIKIPEDHRLFNWSVEVERCTPCLALAP